MSKIIILDITKPAELTLKELELNEFPVCNLIRGGFLKGKNRITIDSDEEKK